MSLRILVIGSVLLCVVGCLGPRKQEPFVSDGRLVKTTSDSFEYTVDEYLRGVIYWLPLQDTNQTKFTRCIVEIKRLDTTTGQTDTVSCDLMKQVETNVYQ